MEEANKPAVAVGANPWVAVVKGFLQFVGGGLEALHDNESGRPLRPPESAASREARERLEGLGISTDHAEQVARSWGAAAAPTDPGPPIPRLSFEDFAKAAAFQLDGRQPGATQAPATTPTVTTEESKPSGPAASAPADLPAPEMPIRVPRSWEEFVQMAACAPPAGAAESARDRPQDSEQQVHFLNERIRRLEAKLHEWQLLISSSGSPSSGSQNTSEIETAAQTSVSGASSGFESAMTITTDRTTGAGGQPPATPARSPSHEAATIVQGPWSASRIDALDGLADDQPRRELVSDGDIQAQRVAALEKTFETFDKLVDGLAVRLGGKGQPSG